MFMLRCTGHRAGNHLWLPPPPPPTPAFIHTRTQQVNQPVHILSNLEVVIPFVNGWGDQLKYLTEVYDHGSHVHACVHRIL